jgi:hypothetical protein
MIWHTLTVLALSLMARRAGSGVPSVLPTRTPISPPIFLAQFWACAAQTPCEQLARQLFVESHDVFRHDGETAKSKCSSGVDLPKPASPQNANGTVYALPGYPRICLWA